jgi:hypothetical protein
MRVSILQLAAAALLLRSAARLQEPRIEDFMSDAPRDALATFFDGCYAEGCVLWLTKRLPPSQRSPTLQAQTAESTSRHAAVA